MSWEPSTSWLAATIILLVGTMLMVVWRRYLSAGSWEQVLARHQRWGSRGPIVLFALVTYVVTSSALIALIAAALLQWGLGSAQQAPLPALTRSPRGAAER